MSVCIQQNNHFSQHLPTRECIQSSQSRGFLGKIKKTIRIWVQRSRQRKQLASLDERLLKDIAYTAEQAHAEYSKPFWK